MIGETLKRERERQNLTLKDVERGTSIREVYLDALERGDLKVLPGEVYAKGFLRNYANFLKLDPDVCMQEFNSLLGETSTEAEKKPETNANAKRQEREGSSGKIFALSFAALFLLGVGIYSYLGNQGVKDGNTNTATIDKKSSVQNQASAEKKDAKPKTEPQTSNVPMPQATVQQSPTEPSGQPSAQPSAQPTQKQKGVAVTANFNGRCWIKVVADGSVVYEGTCEAGTALSWNAANRVRIIAGNAGAIEITHNGNPTGAMGAYGQVADKVFN